jgi:hypothetical protein
MPTPPPHRRADRRTQLSRQPTYKQLSRAAHKIAHLTGTTEGGTYQMLLVALIEAERRLDPREFRDCA